MPKHDLPSEKDKPVSEQERLLFGRRLKAARLKAGMSTYDVEKNTGIRRNRLALIEAGQANPTFETMTVLARVVGQELVHLLTEEADPTG